MTTIHNISAAILACAFGLTVTVQAQPAAAGAVPMAGATLKQDCARPVAKHDHGAEKGTPSPKTMSGPCTPADAARMSSDAASAASCCPNIS